MEFWYAREIMTILEYSKWQNFEKIIEKARLSCENSGINVFEHFTDVSKLSKCANNNVSRFRTHSLFELVTEYYKR